MTVEQVTTFLELVNEAFERVDETAHIEHGVADLPHRQMKIGLSNLAQLCAARPHSEWATLIREQIARSLRIESVQPVDFETAKKLLRLRFRPHGHPDDERIWSRVVAPGLIVNLVLDLPDRVQTLAAEQVNQWGRPAEELWRTALENLIRHDFLPSPKRYVLDTNDPTPTQLAYYLFEGDSMYVAAHALRLPSVDTGIARFGWIFMVPNRHTLYFTGVMNLPECGAALLMLTQGTSNLFARPGLISDQLYWTDGTRFEHLSRPDGMSGQHIVESLQATLKRLAGPTD
jgi:hypothetical protein